ncbi:MAG: hypothetical protein ACR2NR_05450 [Solirubrobacteraceae bacterium]
MRLPAPVTVAAGHVLGSVSYRIGRDGRVRRIPRIPSPFPRDAVLFPATGTWYTFRQGHLVVGRGSKPLWRSRGEIAPDHGSRGRAAPDQLGVMMASSQMVAFQHDHKLYLASLRSPERPVATREMPLGFTQGGLYTYRYRGRELLLRSDTGALLRTIARQPLGSDYFVAGGGLYFIVHGVLMGAHGPRTQQLASLTSLGMPNPWLQPVGRLLELQDNNRIVLLRPDGSEFASTPLPRHDGQPESISSSLVVAPDASAVAFTGASGETNDPNAVQRAHGTETIYLLRAGANTATPVHTEQVAFKVCEREASLQWHRSWLLYSNSEGNLTAIDTTDAHHAIKLGSLVRRLPGTRNGFSANWTGRPARL